MPGSKEEQARTSVEGLAWAMCCLTLHCPNDRESRTKTPGIRQDQMTQGKNTKPANAESRSHLGNYSSLTVETYSI